MCIKKNIRLNKKKIDLILINLMIYYRTIIGMKYQVLFFRNITNNI